MAVAPPQNFRIVGTIPGRKLYFDVDPTATESTIEYDDNGTWIVMGTTTTDYVDIPDTLGGTHLTQGTSKRDKVVGPLGTPESVNYGVI